MLKFARLAALLACSVSVMVPALAGRAQVSASDEAAVVRKVGYDVSSAVWTIELSNGVLAKGREMQADEVAIDIVIAGGELLEDTESRSVTAAVAAALQAGLETDAENAGIKFSRLLARPGADALRVSARVAPDDLEIAAALMALATTSLEPDPERVTLWQEKMIERLQDLSRDPLSAASSALNESIFPDGAAVATPPTADQVRRLTAERIAAWHRERLVRAPITVAVAGPVERDRAMSAVVAAFEALESRPAISAGLFADRRELPKPPERIEHEILVRAESDEAAVVLGWFAPSCRDIESIRELRTAMASVGEQFRAAFSDDSKLEAADFGLAVELAYPGFNHIYAIVLVPSARASDAQSALREAFDQVVRGPFEKDVVEAARAQLVKSAGTAVADPSFWSWHMANARYHDLELGDIARAPEAYREIDGEAARDELLRAVREGTVFSVIASP